MTALRLDDIAKALDLEIDGDGELLITAIAPLADATAGQISFIAHDKYRSDLQASKAAAVIMHKSLAADFSGTKLYSDNPYLSFAQLTALFDDRPNIAAQIHPRAVIADSALIAATAAIAANVVIGEHVVIGERCQIAANTVISDKVVIGDDCYIAANVSIYHGVQIGHHVTVHSGTVIGCDGFGFAPNKQSTTASQWQKIHQLGSVVIGNYVEIGANTAIDRGALENTVIKDGVIIDNHVHIAHNCIIGENTALAAGVAMAGSTIIGRNCTFGGCVGIAGHISIADNSHFSGMAMVTGNIKEAGQYSSGTALSASNLWRKNAVRFNQLDQLFSRVRGLEKKSAENE
jgi:UDP-3-O-[3-hydroxymyristoyl] glucosamine N-acyltransferase